MASSILRARSFSAIYRRGSRRRLTRQLMKLDDQILTDIGLTRTDVANMDERSWGVGRHLG